MPTKPNFFILGAAKAGTTSLYEILAQHPQVYQPFNKETAFFNDDGFFAKGQDWYLKTYFNQSEGALARGEATPHYLYWAEKTAPRIRAAFRDEPLRFIVILREPASRAYSWYWNMRKEGQENLSFADALAAEPARLQQHHARLYANGSMRYGYLRGGQYAAQIEQFLEFFPVENFLFLLQEDLMHRFAWTTRKLSEFLGIDPNFAFKPTLSNPSGGARNVEVQKMLRERSPLKELFKNLIPARVRYTLKELALRGNSLPFTYPPLSPSTALALKAQFAAGNSRLASLIGRDLSGWNQPEA